MFARIWFLLLPVACAIINDNNSLTLSSTNKHQYITKANIQNAIKTNSATEPELQFYHHHHHALHANRDSALQQGRALIGALDETN